MEELAAEQGLADENVPEAEAPAPKKKYMKRSLVVKPEEALGEDQVPCCLCGRGFQNLTAHHLLSHDLTVEEYKKLCGYAPDQKLISHNLLERLQENVQKVQRSREKKRTGSTLTRRKAAIKAAFLFIAPGSNSALRGLPNDFHLLPVKP